MSNPTPRVLPPFPVDDEALRHLEHALNTCIDITDEGERKPVGGEFTLPKLLAFLSGYDPERTTDTGREIDGIPVFEVWDPQYSEHDVMRALVAEVRRLRDANPGEQQ